MPDDSGGVYTVPPGTLVNTGDTLLPSQHNPWALDMSTAMSNRFSKDGRAPATGNWNLNTFRITNLGAPVATNDATTKQYVDTTASDSNLTGIFNRTHIAGATISTNASNPVNGIDFNPGEAVSSDSSYFLIQCPGITKRVDAIWAAGANNGGLDTGSVANTDYHCYIIRNPTTTAVDALFSTNPTTPNVLPTGFTQYRRVASIKRQVGSNLAFTQIDDTFYLGVTRQDLNAGNPGTAGILRTLTVPSGIVVEAIYSCTLDSQTINSLYACLLTPVLITDTAPAYGSVMTFGLQTGSAAGFYRSSVTNRTYTNTAGQIRQRLSASDAGMATTIMTHGWVDRRGKA